MREKKHRHFWMISVWVVYFIIFYIAEHVVTGNYYPVHMPLDDMIPFCEWFIFPYCLWHWLLAIVGVYLLLWDAENFKRFTAFIGIGFIPVMLFDIAFPNGQDLRPLVFERQNIATWLVARIYAADTNTNVFPSMHVIGSAEHPQARARLGDAAARCFDLHLHGVCQAALLSRHSRRDPLQRARLVAGLRRDLQKEKSQMIHSAGCGQAASRAVCLCYSESPLSPFWRMVILTGVPVRPNTARI